MYPEERIARRVSTATGPGQATPIWHSGLGCKAYPDHAKVGKHDVSRLLKNVIKRHESSYFGDLGGCEVSGLRMRTDVSQSGCKDKMPKEYTSRILQVVKKRSPL